MNLQKEEAHATKRSLGAKKWNLICIGGHRNEKETFRRLALAAGVLIMSVPLFAHHGNAAFDTSKRLTLKGTVTEWVWANPHCWLKFDVKNDKGEVTHWLAEETNPPGLINSGWYKDSLKVGDEVTVILIPTKNGQSLGRVDRVVLANGKVLRYFGEGGGGQ
jgi:Family of unknown function (DUF6152)